MKWFSPRRLFVLSFVIWLLLSVIAPFSYTLEPNVAAFVLLASFIGFFLLGTYSYDIVRRLRTGGGEAISACDNVDSISRNSIQIAYWLIAGIAVGGLVLRFYDLVALKSFFAFESITDFRLSYDASQVNVGGISILSAVAMPFALVLPMLGKYYGRFLSRAQRVLGWLCFSGLLGYFVMRGGRTSITVSIAMLVTVAVLNSGTKRFRISRRTWMIAGAATIIGAVFFLYSLNILVERLDRMGFSIVTGLEHLETHRHLEIDEQIMLWAEESEFVAGLTYTSVSLLHYFLHGYHQFFLLVNTFDLNYMTTGATQFYPIAKFLGALGFETWTAAELEAILAEPAVYYTFFGPVYMDFGYWGFAYCWLFGLLVQLSWTKARHGDVLHRMLYPFFASVLIHSSYLNMIQAGAGTYILCGVLASGFVLRIASRYGDSVLLKREVAQPGRVQLAGGK